MLHIQDHPVQKNISDPVSFNEVTSLHYSSYTTYTWEKKSMLYQRLNKVTILQKRELTLDFVEEALKILMYLQESLFGITFF